MAKINKPSQVKPKTAASTGEFVVVKPAVSSKLKSGQIRDAVRKVRQALSGKQ